MVTELIFKKNLQELTIEDLKSFFLSEQKESNVLEFKSIDSSDIQNSIIANNAVPNQVGHDVRQRIFYSCLKNG